jgi:formylglycine-generating enzyme required for sulfatase activity
VGPFWIGRVPVSNRQWREFIGDGGYQRQELWSARGWAHRTEAGLERPLFILRTGVVASEPYDDDPGWADVPDHHLADMADGVVTVTELEA